MEAQVKGQVADFAAICCGRTVSIAVEKISWRNGGLPTFAAFANQ
jgi:hypothetical protein